MKPVDIAPADLETIRRILHEHAPGLEARAFGSRVSWTARETSDLDLALMTTEPLDADRIAVLGAAFTDSDLPFRVDIVDWAGVSENFRKTVEKDCVALAVVNANGDMACAWPNVALENLIDLRISGVDKKINPGEDAVRLCNYMDVYRNSFIHGGLDFMNGSATKREVAKYSLRSGDVIITKDSEKHDDIGVPALVREDVPNLLCGYHLAILRPASPLIDGTYLFYALSTFEAQKQFHSYANGITRFGLRKADIGLAEIPLPPLPDQQAIAGVLCALDDRIALNRRINETLEAMAQAVFEDWFVDFGPARAKIEGREPYLAPELWSRFPDHLVDSQLGGIPEGWTVNPLSEAIELNPRRSLRKGKAAPYLDMANMPTKGHVPRAVVDRPYSSGMRFVNGDTLVSRITPCLENGKIAHVDFLLEGEVGWGSTEYIVMRSKGDLPEEFVYYLARSTGFREFAVQNMTGTSGRQRVPATALSLFPFPVPPRAITDGFRSLVGPLMARISKADRESRLLAALRDSLLPKLVSGELRVNVDDRSPGEPVQ